jgi:hypothetical protein
MLIGGARMHHASHLGFKFASVHWRGCFRGRGAAHVKTDHLVNAHQSPPIYADDAAGRLRSKSRPCPGTHAHRSNPEDCMKKQYTGHLDATCSTWRRRMGDRYASTTVVSLRLTNFIIEAGFMRC